MKELKPMKTPPTLQRETPSPRFPSDRWIEAPTRLHPDFYPAEETCKAPESLTMFSLREIFREMERKTAA
jgi:hypothetical protein